MGCYKCDSPEGNEARLCPKCTEERLNKMRQDREAEHAERKTSDYTPDLPPEPDSVGVRAVKAGGAAVFTGILVWLFFFSVYGPGWGMGRGEFAYKRCMYKVNKGIAEKGSDLAGDEVSKSFGIGFLKGVGTAACASLRDECNTNPSGDACQTLVKAL